jgi:hypothetical protein
LFKNYYDYKVEDNDSIYVPKKSDLVFINGNGQKRYDYMGEIYISAPFKSGYNAKKVINDYALGFSRNANRRNLSVSYPNGKYDRTKRILFFNIYPKVKPGGIINISKKQVKEKVRKDRKPLDWNQLVATVTSAAMGFGTVYALITRP